jgi:uncharacterized protein YbjT (DUF2867 family)
MTDKPVIAVVGATGAQGGGLVRAILDDPTGPFTVRVLTRKPDSPRAQQFAARGAEVVRADLDDEASLKAAFDKAYGAFVMTNAWERRTPEQTAARSGAQMELDQAANAARAAKATALRHVIWSTLEDTRPHFHHLGIDVPTLEKDYLVPHFDGKANANAYFTSLGVPTTLLEITFFYEAFLRGQGPHRDPDGHLVLSIPLGDSMMALVAAEDIGRTAYGIFQVGARLIGRTVGLAGTHATGKQLAELFANLLGEPVAYRPQTYEQVRNARFPRAEEMAANFRFFTDASENLIANRPLDRIRAINPQLQTLEEWATKHREQLNAAL